MKKLTKSFLVMILGLLMSVNVMADVQTARQDRIILQTII